jgi:hypothetical protein
MASSGKSAQSGKKIASPTQPVDQCLSIREQIAIEENEIALIDQDMQEPGLPIQVKKQLSQERRAHTNLLIALREALKRCEALPEGSRPTARRDASRAARRE